MSRIAGRLLPLLIPALLAGGCGSGPPPPPAAAPASLATCRDPRPEICTRQYLPVCGRQSNGESRTYGNACDACADPRVESYRPGPCE